MSKTTFEVGANVRYKGQERVLINQDEKENKGYLMTTSREMGMTAEDVSLDELESIEKPSSLKAHFHVGNAQELEKQGLIARTGMGHAVGMVAPGGPLPIPVPTYTIEKWDKNSLRKIWPNLSWNDKQKIVKELGEI